MSTKKTNQKKFKRTLLNLTKLERELQAGFEKEAIERYRKDASLFIKIVREYLNNYIESHDEEVEIEKNLNIVRFVGELEVTLDIMIGINGKVDEKVKRIVRLLMEIYQELNQSLLHLNINYKAVEKQKFSDLESIIDGFMKVSEDIPF
ncbi:hypothetical protein ACLIA0_14145 [Bacillaceae bacterium W0354]